MADFVTFRHSQTGQAKAVKIGFSWTAFFFGATFGAPFWLRKVYSIAAIAAAFSVFVTIINWNGTAHWVSGAVIGISIWFGMEGNKLTAQYYLAHGWEFADPESATADIARQKWKLP